MIQEYGKATARRGSLHLAVVFVGLLFLSGRIAAQELREPEMIFVAGGSFTMGCTFEQGSDCASDEKPSHEVQITGFTIAKYEVTQALWKEVMGNNPSRFKGDSLPVENVTWDDVQIFLQRLNAKTGKKYRLPTEAEWEYAARGGNKSNQTQFSGGFDLETVAWCSANSENSTHNVGEKQPNELGLYDMSGNVWEWCSDYYGQYNSDKQVNPAGAKKGTARMLRGGCYAAIGKQCRVSSRKSLYQGGKDFMTGFRLAMDDDREARAAEAAKNAELERISKEKAAADSIKRVEQERIAAEKAAEQQRLAAEKATADSIKRVEQARIAAEKQAEQERIAAEKAAEQQRLAAEKATADSIKRVEQARIAAEKQAEQERVAAERQAQKETHAKKMQHRRDSLHSLPWQTFFTVNAACSGQPQLSYGFKVGQVKFVGWYLSAMSNFNLNGAFSPFKDMERYVLTGRQKDTRISATAGIVVLPTQLLSIHIGAGFGYSSLNMETESGWHSYPKRTCYGPEAAFGLMFRIKGFAISAEAVCIAYDFNKSDLKFTSRMEGKIGIGFCLPNKKK